MGKFQKTYLREQYISGDLDVTEFGAIPTNRRLGGSSGPVQARPLPADFYAYRSGMTEPSEEAMLRAETAHGVTHARLAKAMQTLVQDRNRPAHPDDIRATLLVLFSTRVEECRSFYSGLGLRFTAEQHGRGPAH